MKVKRVPTQLVRQDYFRQVQNFYLRSRNSGMTDDDEQPDGCVDACDPTVGSSEEESGETQDPHNVVWFCD